MEVLTVVRTWWRDFVSLVFPRVCEVCGRQLVDGEELMCTYCNVAMPRTGLHLSDFNELHHKLAGGVRIERAASWFAYRRHSPYARLIHKAKYYDRPEIARCMGRMYAREIMPSGFFDGIDLILPVPMYSLKELKRGYNQAAWVCYGFNDVTGIPLGDNLKALHGHSSQTRRGAYDRYLNVSGLFGVINPLELSGRHVLVVDDVLTTGSTLQSCCEAIAAAVPDVRISVATLAAASRL